MQAPLVFMLLKHSNKLIEDTIVSSLLQCSNWVTEDTNGLSLLQRSDGENKDIFCHSLLQPSDGRTEDNLGLTSCSLSTMDLTLSCVPASSSTQVDELKVSLSLSF